MTHMIYNVVLSVFEKVSSMYIHVDAAILK